MPDYDNPEVEAQWLAERREEIAHYLRGEGVEHGQIGDEPVWWVTPYVSIWAIESRSNLGSVGWWGISGDLPNDYVSASKAKDPREALFNSRFVIPAQAGIQGIQPHGFRHAPE